MLKTAVVRVTCAAILAVAFLTPLGLSAQEVRYRKHVDDLTDQEWQTLDYAIGRLKANDPNPWPSQAPWPTNNYEYYVRIHGDLSVVGCDHTSELVWTWHRAFLLHFENTLRAIDPSRTGNITIPYWDWTDMPTGQKGYPSAFETYPKLMHDRNSWPKSTKSPLELAQGLQSGKGKQYVADLVAQNDWAMFGGGASCCNDGSLEHGPHNNIHGTYIGIDNLNTIRAVADPVFWGHHSNLDRLVDEWQQRHGRYCLNCDHIVYSVDSGAGPETVKSLLDNKQLPLGGNKTVAISYLPKGQGPQLLAAVQARIPAVAALLAAGSVPVPGTSPPQRLFYRFRFPDLSTSRLALKFSGLRVPQTDSYFVDVFMYPASATFRDTPQFREKYRVGRVGRFASTHAGHGGEHGPETDQAMASSSMDITNAARELRAKSPQQVEWKIAIEFAAADPNKTYGAIAPEVGLRRVTLLRSDFSTTNLIPLEASAP